jgi:hypothetical protein
MNKATNITRRIVKKKYIMTSTTLQDKFAQNILEQDANHLAADLIEKTKQLPIVTKSARRSKYVIAILLFLFIVFWVTVNIIIPIIQLRTMHETEEHMRYLKRNHYELLHNDAHYKQMTDSFKVLQDVTTFSAILFLFCAGLGLWTFETKIRGHSED